MTKRIVRMSAVFSLSLALVACSAGSREPSAAGNDGYGTGNLDSPAAAERHGCCSDKGGACGCGHGKVQCCDGSFSSNCGCE